MIIKGKILDPLKRTIFDAIVTVQDGIIKAIEQSDEDYSDYIIPGYIDAHVHVESSMLIPSEFAAVAVKHGTIGVVADPHEIANVCGEEGINFMIDNGEDVPLEFLFGLPSCVPATHLESSGAVIDGFDTDRLLAEGRVGFLAEMMNFPGVLAGDKEVMMKLESARRLGMVIDGHAPGVKGKELINYISCGISTDHEAVTLEEATEKINRGMKILIREGSAARNLDALHFLVSTNPDKVMLCCDDIHPETLIKGHINLIVKKLLSLGHDIFDVFSAATVNPVNHYGIDVGLLQVGHRADFQVVSDLSNLTVKEVYIKGKIVFGDNSVLFDMPLVKPVNSFNSSKVNSGRLRVIAEGNRMRVIRAYDGQLITVNEYIDVQKGWEVKPDTGRDILKLVVKERYNDKAAVSAFITGFGLKRGAFAGSVAHDSHNIIAVGCDDRSIAEAINMVVEMKGGLSVYDNGPVLKLELPVGGIMSDVPCGTIARKYEQMSDYVKEMGSGLRAPFMTLSFMSLLVIPEIKLGDRGLFELSSFSFVDQFEE
ncbi:MAG: adenine deaminase [Bacteroidales bacterium]|nr:adenine deaminase [Bacteroidales bacterium]